jgi:hypothetical protein
MFQNCHDYNQEDSQIYLNVEILQNVFDVELRPLSRAEGFDWGLSHFLYKSFILINILIDGDNIPDDAEGGHSESLFSTISSTP